MESDHSTDAPLENLSGARSPHRPDKSAHRHRAILSLARARQGDPPAAKRKRHAPSSAALWNIRTVTRFVFLRFCGRGGA